MDLQGWRLTLSHPDQDGDISISLRCTEKGNGTENQKACECLLGACSYGASVTSMINSNEVCDWLKSVLHVKCSLVCLSESTDMKQPLYRPAAQHGTRKGFGSFANAGGVSLLSTSNLSLLEEDLYSTGWKNNLDMSRFRMNILVDVVKHGPLEDEWEEFIVGDCTFDKPKSCSRCDIVMVNHTTGQKDGKPVFLALGERRRKTGKMSLGVICIPTRLSRLKVGDPIHLPTKRSAP